MLVNVNPVVITCTAPWAEIDETPAWPRALVIVAKVPAAVPGDVLTIMLLVNDLARVAATAEPGCKLALLNWTC